MRSNIIFVIQFLVLCSLSAQEWRTELAKHDSKPVIEIITEMDKYFDEVGATRANKYHHYIRWQIQAVNHMDGDGMQCNYIAKNQSLLKGLGKAEQQNSSNTRYFQGAWESVNPNNFQTPINDMPNMGRIDAIAISPTDPNVLYAGATGGGVWKSWNHGANWFPLWDGMVQMGVSDIVIDYSNSNHILAVSGSADSQGIPSSGVIESYDGGSTWIQRFDFDMADRRFCYKMIQNPADQNIFYLSVMFQNINGSNTGIIHKLNTSSGTQSAITTSTAVVFDMEYQIGSPNTLYLSTNKGLYKMDENENITSVSSPGLPSSSQRSELAVAPSDQNYIYYFNAVASDNYSLYRSTNGGTTFIEMMNETTTGDTLIDQISINLNLAVDPVDKNKVYVGSVRYSTSIDSGVIWTVDMEGMHADVHDIVIQNGKHYVCTDGGISYRNLGSTDWLDINNGLLVTQFYKMDKQGNKLVGGAQDNGTIFWDEGDAIGIRKIGGDGFDCVYHPTLANRIITTTQEDLLYSNDNGDSNTETIPHLWAAPIVHWEGIPSRVITFDKSNLRFSYNSGTTWPDSIDIFTNPGAYLITGFSQCASNPNIAYASADKQLVKTLDLDQLENSDWSVDITPTLNAGLIFRNILVHPDNCNEVYVTLAGYNQEQIYKSVNGGSTWTAFNQGLKNIPVYCIYYDHVNEDAFYIGTELGVFYRKSTMSEWIPFNTYLPRVQVMDLNVTDTHVYAATFGRGIWKSPSFKSCVNSLTLTQVNDPTNGTPSGQQIHKVSNVLTSNRIIQGGLGSDVLYQAGNYLDLTAGFHARVNNTFMAKAAGCEN